MLSRLTLLLFISFQLVNAQLNLGSFNLNKGNNGDLLLGFGQGGNLFGFGGDRALQVTIGPGKFGANSNSGLSLGGERLGVDSIFGIDENRGINLGSFLNSNAQQSLGSQHSPGGELGQLLHSLMSAFSMSPNRRPSSSGREFRPPPIAGGIENRHRPKQVETTTTTAFIWPTPIVPVSPLLVTPTTTESVFPTLVSMWRPNGDEDSLTEWSSGSGFMPMGVVDGQGVDRTTRKPMTTEGRAGPITSQSKGNERTEMNSGEASKTPDKKHRFGPPPPSGLIDIDSKEEFKRRN